jgi:uncharacterized protein (TIGR02147 family)
MKKHAAPGKAPTLPRIWEYTDYRNWLTDTFQARKALYAWYSYGVLAQRAGFKARDFLLRVMRGEKRLSADGAVRLAGALDLSPAEQEYFLALVEFNQAKKEPQRKVAWERLQAAIAQGRSHGTPRRLSGLHAELVSGWRHLALRTLLEMRPDPGDAGELGRRLRPPQAASSIRRSLLLLQQGGLAARHEDGLWHATDKSLVAPPDVGPRPLRQFHRECLRLAEESLESVPAGERNITGLTMGISARTYELLCTRLAELHLEFGKMAELDEEADRVYHLSLALFPLSHPLPAETP